MKRTTAFAVLALAGVAGLTACNDQASIEPTATVHTSASAVALQRQFVDVVKSVSPAVVEIQCGPALGSGIVFDESGDVVTNAHVVGSARSCEVTLSDGSRHSSRVVGRDTGHDIAVVHLSSATPPAARFGNSDDVLVGDMVLAMGNPLGLRSSVTDGIVSSLNRSAAESASVDLSTLIQTSAEINPGNSGGALVDLSGRVIGVPTLSAVDPEFGNEPAHGIGFAIPSNVVKSVASTLIGSS
jgi:S1-C subfamily serine protease